MTMKPHLFHATKGFTHVSHPIKLPGSKGPSEALRAALHREAGPIRCVRGLKSSLVIGQKAQIGPNPFKPKGHADLVVCVFDYKFVFMTGPKLIESGAPKMEGQFLA
jgi:hypothetical protein